jgi:hypothetical protein
MKGSIIARAVSLVALSAAALLGAPLTASAQEPAPSAVVAPAGPVVSAPIAPTTAPRLGPIDAPAGIVRTSAETSDLALQSPGPNNRNVLWMIVGGGMMLGGTLIGDDVGTVVSVTGLVIGLVGLYRYLR